MIFDLLANLEHTSPSSGSICQWLLKHPERAEGLTITELAQQTGESNSSIIRFCQKLGFKGFKDFKIELIKDVSSHKDQPFQAIDYNFPFNDQADLEEIRDSLAEVLKRTLTAVQTTLDLDTVQEAIWLLSKARRIFIFGKGDSYLQGVSFANWMSKLDIWPILAERNQEAPVAAVCIDPSDCALFINFSAYHADYKSYLTDFKERGIPSLIITARPQSELAQLCDCVLRIPTLERNEGKISNFTSRVAIDFILDVLYSGIFKQNYLGYYIDKLSQEQRTSSILRGEYKSFNAHHDEKLES